MTTTHSVADNALIDKLQWRYATKKMNPAKKVPQDKVERILEAARLAPTSSGLLVLLATANVGWGQWARYILPLFLIYAVLAMVLLAIAVQTGY